MSAPPPTLASLLGSQADAFEQQLHAQQHAQQQAQLRARSPAFAPQAAPGSRAKKGAAAHSPALTGARSPALGAMAPLSLSLATPFTHTLHTPQLLSSLIALTAPHAIAPAASAPKAKTAAAAAAVSGVAQQLQGSLEGAQALLAQLLPTSVEDTPKPAEFHALLLQYLEACGAALAPEEAQGQGRAAAVAEGKKKRKRGEDNDAASAAAPSDAATVLALHSVSTTVIGRLAARCIQLLNDSTPASSAAPHGAFNPALLRSTSSYWSILALLLRSDSLSARFTPSLFSLLTRHDALPLIESALVHMHDAAERDLVELTKYALDNLPAPAVSTAILPAGVTRTAQPTKKQRKKAAHSMITLAAAHNQQVHVVEVPGGAFAVILDLLLTSPLSATFLRHSLSSLSPSHAHKLMYYLYAWTLRYWFHTDTELYAAIHALNKKGAAAAAAAASATAPASAASGVSTSGPLRVPSLSQVFDWMNILLDAVDFFRVYSKQQQRAATAEAEGAAASSSSDRPQPLSLSDLLSSLSAHLSHHHLQLVEDSQDLKGFLALFTLLKRTPNAAHLPQQPMMDYAIETIEFGA